MAQVMPDLLLDTRSLICPLPVLKTKKALDSLQPGQVLEVRARDAAAKSDIIYLAQRLKLELIDLSEEDGHIRITIKK
jgi:TusA-related sulfurtransferase